MILTSTRLGIIACRYLVGGYFENRYISAPEIAKCYNMNVRALMPALNRLTRAGILRSRVGGKTPGFIFAKTPENISIYQVFDALEGRSAFSCCREVIQDLKCDCCNKTECAIHLLFNGVLVEAMKKLKAVSILDHYKSSGGALDPIPGGMLYEQRKTLHAQPIEELTAQS